MSEAKRLYVGGLAENITEEELCDRFNRFGDVTNIDVRSKHDILADEKKTFAYINLKITDDKLDKCIKVYNNSKWRGKQLQVQVAKECFLQRLQKERQIDDDGAGEEKRKLPSDDHEKIKETIIKATPEGTPVDNMRNWVVGSQGKILPVVYIRRKDKKKVIKVDPSKYIHHNRMLDDETQSSVLDPADIPVDSLTWFQEEERQNNGKQYLSDSSRKLTKTSADSQLRHQGQEAVRKQMTRSNRQKSQHSKYNGNFASNHRQASGTVGFSSDGDDDDDDDNEISQTRLSTRFGSSEDTDEILLKLKMSSRNVKSQKTIKSERMKAQRMSGRSNSDIMDDSSSDEASEGSVDAVQGRAKPLPKWLESESESDLDQRTSTSYRHVESSADGNVANCRKLPSGSTTITSPVVQLGEAKAELRLNNKRKSIVKMVPVDKPASDVFPESQQSMQKDDVRRMPDKVRKEFTPKRRDNIDYVQKVLNEYSSGFQEPQQSDHSSTEMEEEEEELDVFEVIESGKVSKLYKDDSLDLGKNKNSCVKRVTSMQPIKVDVAKEMSIRQSSKVMMDTAVEGTSVVQKGNEKVKKLCTAEKAARVNEKRLNTLKERMLETRQQKTLVQQALAVVDSKKHVNKKILFDSDEEMEMLEEIKQAEKSDDRVSCSGSDLDMAVNKKVKSQRLFESDSEDSFDDGDVTDSDKERFKIRPEFEGKAGRKLLQLQSRFGNDTRFRLDRRFMENSSADDSDSEDEVNKGKDDATSEKNRALEILKSLVGHRADRKKQEKTFKDINTLHYDPASNAHLEFEIPVEKKRKKKIRQKIEVERGDVEKDEPKEDKPELPEVSSDRFYDVESSLKDLFGVKDKEEKPFSLTSAFGHVSEDEEIEDDGDLQEKKVVDKNIASWQQPMNHKDSSDEEDDDSIGGDEEDMNNMKSACNPLTDINSNKQKGFFLQLSDPEVQESLQFFTSPEDKNEMRRKWLEARPGLVEAYRMKRKRSLREAHLNQKFKVNKRGHRR